MTKELVAVGATVHGRCPLCFRHHVGKVRGLGVDEEDIKAAADLGSKISEVGGQRIGDFVIDSLEEKLVKP